MQSVDEIVIKCPSGRRPGELDLKGGVRGPTYVGESVLPATQQAKIFHFRLFHGSGCSMARIA